jgi:hypothetical protein
MTTVKRTKTEYSGTRRYKYPDSTNNSIGLSDSPRTWNDAKFILKHRDYFFKDKDDKRFYVIQFDVDDFKSDEISIKTEGLVLYFSLILNTNCMSHYNFRSFEVL